MTAASLQKMNEWWFVCDDAKRRRSGFKCAESVEKINTSWYTYHEDFIEEIPHLSQHYYKYSRQYDVRATVVFTLMADLPGHHKYTRLAKANQDRGWVTFH
jgi:hypothetical protein